MLHSCVFLLIYTVYTVQLRMYRVCPPRPSHVLCVPSHALHAVVSEMLQLCIEMVKTRVGVMQQDYRKAFLTIVTALIEKSPVRIVQYILNTILSLTLPSCPSLSHLAPHSPILSLTLPFCPSLSYLVPHSPILSLTLPSCPSLSHFVPHSPILSLTLPSCPSLFYLVPHSPILSLTLLSCPSLSHLIPHSPILSLTL